MPAPRPKVFWESDLAATLKTAQAENRPVFVTMRCVPCKQCSDFDKSVLEGGPELDPLLAHFETVRITSASGVDFRLLPMEGFQDFDLSWWGWFLSPEGRLYGVFGGRDSTSDSARVSVPALQHALERVLAYHYDPRHKTWDVDGPTPDLSGEAQTPEKLPGFASWAKHRSDPKATCLHCHEIAEILRQPAIDAKTFDKTKDFDMWPYPENVGVRVSRDDGLVVTLVDPPSPAGKLGIKSGDMLVAAEGRRLFSQADLRAALQRGPRGGGKIDVMWLHAADGSLAKGELEVEDGWRKNDVSWRKSVAEGEYGAHPGLAWFFQAKPEERKKFNLPEDSMAIRPFFGKESGWLAMKAGVRPDDWILAVNGQSPDLGGREFLVWFRLNFDIGARITYRLVDPRGKKRDVTFVAGPRAR
jgi:hypothetical protein